MKSRDASASGVLEVVRPGHGSKCHELCERHDGRHRNDRRDEREGHVPARIGCLTCRNADGVIAAKRENQQQRSCRHLLTSRPVPLVSKRLKSTNHTPTTMKSASGTSLATVNTLIKDALGRMPRKLIHRGLSVTAEMDGGVGLRRS